ncbi:MAG: hypothetical protein KatS3mg016_1111 [Fimbriimonadales bacterium]|nr:MAG: hypothetical protein KatS3mg016_1111 [Fimbriimonadales bacterium]
MEHLLLLGREPLLKPLSKQLHFGVFYKAGFRTLVTFG